ncbi:MAG: hypothetical protein HY755_09900 [Nitrospirae bacterium]|nr:hypothetical protein [Nitrospirota bacterium]
MKRAILLLFVLSFFFSCSDKEVKKVTEESLTAQEAFTVAEAIKDAYLNKNLSSIESNTTKESYRELFGAIKSFDKASLTLSPKWVEIEKSTVSVKIAWDGTWVVRGKTTEEQGVAIFVFEGKPLKLSRILKANPFRQPE